MYDTTLLPWTTYFSLLFFNSKEDFVSLFVVNVNFRFSFTYIENVLVILDLQERGLHFTNSDLGLRHSYSRFWIVYYQTPVSK